jgi:alpha-N-acetylglucosaminidase
MPLAAAGQEYIWDEVYRQLDLQSADMEQYYTGPAYLPWQRMGNIHGWAGNSINHIRNF